MARKHKTSLLLLLLFCCATSYAQEHSLHQPQAKYLLLAQQQYGHGQYLMAGQSARRAMQEMNSGSIPQNSIGDQAKAGFYLYASGLKMQEEGADDSAKKFLNRLQPAAYTARLSFALAQYYFKKERLSEAIPYYEQADIAHLSNDEIADQKFELAYSYFNNRQFVDATPLFQTIKELRDGKYYSAGNYYYGLLAYHEGNYKDALASFQRIDQEEQYRAVVPYYIAEIYYFNGDRKKALDEALRLMKKKEKSFYDKELHLLAAQVLFEDQRYGEALPYFEYYYSNSDKIRKEELYEMGYSYYRVNEWKNAVEKFKPLSNSQDSLGQTAMYLLGDCYLKTGDKSGARNAFGICAGMPYNAGQREAALLLHARISYELGYNSDASRSVATLLQDYPKSAQRNEAQTLQSELYLNSGDYEAAFNALTTVQQRDPTYNVIYQRSAYGRAMQLLQSGSRQRADSILGLSLLYPADDAYTAAAYFWRSDIAYHNNRPTLAMQLGQDFLNTLSIATEKKLLQISPSATRQHANLTMGYAALDAEEYDKARVYFANAKKGGDSKTAGNAALREGDAAFMQKDYSAASNLYDNAQNNGGSDADYAKLQRAILLGIQGKNNDKIALLQSIINAKPESVYLNDARYELATVLFEQRKYAEATAQLLPLSIQKNSALAAKSLLKLGSAYELQDRDEEAIATYTQVVRDYPASEERIDALKGLKILYIEGNQPDAYANLLKASGLSQTEDAELDSAFYAAAESRYAAGDFKTAVPAFQKYLQQYPQGVFSTRANYYLAESALQSGDKANAIKGFTAVLDMPWSEFSEVSANRAANIAYEANDFDNAIGFYTRLRNDAQDKNNLILAYTGMMRSYGKQNNLTLAAAAADTLLTLPELTTANSNEARYYQAKLLQQNGQFEEAFILYKDLQNGPNSATAAEARYYIAAYYLKKGKLKEAEDAANRAIKLSTGNDEWIVKSYLLYADVLVLQKDYFNAKAILQSIIKNNKSEGLKAEAAAKLEEVKKAEQANSKLLNE